MTIDWWTLGLQAANFLVLVWVLTRVLYRPVRQVIAERQARVNAALDAARAREAAAEEARRRHERALAEFEERKRALAAQAEAELEALRAQRIAKAEAEAEAIREAARRAAQETRARAIDAARADIAALAATLAGRVLQSFGAACGADDAPAQIAAFERALAQMEPAERAALASPGADAALVTARALDEDARAAWREALGRLVGAPPRLTFRVDPALLGGFVLTMGGAELRLAWADFLSEARARLARSMDDAP
ncbi:F0F1 ATP synthase subunit delta [Oceanicella actignis]|uniref:F0F1 ATP synthase subunit delta n=1 Tax=Oceanicella actignis TaxID=1189325 RepID=UPI0011E8826F|nr:F0F1 ATP synthase subunit delta [Oceanicella actignis]TYO91604.1 F-type H+-transporting ATPase subunit b [Oceanicella actignis]